MGDNVHQYGFRWSVAANGGKPCPTPVRHFVASGQNDQNDGAGFSIHLRPGDPVKLVSTGGVTIANTTDAVYGIIVGIGQYYEASTGLMRSGPYWPNQTTWGTIESRRGHLLVVPAKWGLWEVDVDDKVTATTYAAYHAFRGENVTHTCAGVAANLSADPRIDVSTHNTTNTLIWRIHDLSSSSYNRDYSGSNVKLIVRVNVSQEAASVAAANVVAGV